MIELIIKQQILLKGKGEIMDHGVTGVNERTVSTLKKSL